MALINNKEQWSIWENFWAHRSPSLNSAFPAFDRSLTRLLLDQKSSLPPDPVVLEVGCGGSVFLPSVTLGLGARLGIGIDYSWKGCELARRSLFNFGVAKGHIINGDVMEGNPIKEESCDLVYSLGLIEHFDDLISILRAHTRCLKVGGILVVGAPNFVGLTGSLQRRLDPSVFDGWATVVRREQLIEALVNLGLTDVSVIPFGFFNPDMISWGQMTPARRIFKKIVFATAFLASSLLERTGLNVSSPKISSYWIGIGVKSSAVR